ncbi:MAG: FecR domain-containing protein [Myxococcota bacterium]
MNGDYGVPDGAQDDVQSDPDVAYEALMARARGALEASGDLSPSEWVRVRAGIDEGIEGSGGTQWAWLAAAVAAACALLLSFQPGAVIPPQSDEAGSELASTEVNSASVSADQGLAAQSRAATFEAGQVVVSSMQPEVMDAFGRHRLVLAPSSELEVLSWAPTDLAVHLRKGEVTANIAKAAPGERVEVRTESAVARVVGTQFSVALEESGATRVEVEEGVVEVSSRSEADAKPERVTAGKVHRVKARGTEAVAPKMAKPERPTKRRASGKSKRDAYRLIEIDVPPQKAPNAR